MPVTVAEGIVVVTADGTKIPKQIADDIERGRDKVEGAGRRSGDGFLASFGGSALGVGLASIATGIASSIGNAIGAGLRTGLDFAIQGIDIASGLQEANTAIDAVFGDAGAATIKAFAEGTAATLGQSELAALKAAQTFGVYGNAAGLAGKENAAFSSTLVGLGSDLASFYDTSPEEAIEALGAGLRGESEPLRRYGILLDDATLKGRAMSMGLIETKVDAVALERAQIKLETAQKKLTDAQAEYGEGSLEARTAAVDLTAAQEDLGKITEANATGPLTQQQRVLAAQAEILAQAGVATGDFERTSGGLANQQRILAAELENAKGKLGEALLPAMLDLTNFANDQLVPMLDDVIDTVGPQLATAMKEGGPLLTDLLKELGPLLPDLIELGTTALPVLIDVIDKGTPIIKAGAEGATEFFNAWKAASDFMASDASAESAEKYFADIGEESAAMVYGQQLSAAAFMGIIPIYDQGTGQIKGSLSMLEAAAQGHGFIMGAFYDQLGADVQAVDVSVNASLDSMVRGMGMAPDQVAGAWARMGEDIARFEREANANINGFIGIMGSIPGRTIGALSSAGSWLYDTGKNIISGMIRGVDSMIGSAVSSVKNVGGQMLDGVKSFLGIKSPSTVFDEEVGQMMGAGAIRGWKKSMAGFGGEVATTFGDIPNGIGASSMMQSRVVAAPTAAPMPTATGNTFVVEQTIAYSDPTIAGRQAGRALAERLGI